MELNKNIPTGTMLWLTFHEGFLHNKLLKVVKGNTGKCFAIIDWVTYEEVSEDRYSIENYIGETYAYVCVSKQSKWSKIIESIKRIDWMKVKEVIKDLPSGAAGAVSHR